MNEQELQLIESGLKMLEDYHYIAGNDDMVVQVQRLRRDVDNLIQGNAVLEVWQLDDVPGWDDKTITTLEAKQILAVAREAVGGICADAIEHAYNELVASK